MFTTQDMISSSMAPNQSPAEFHVPEQALGGFVARPEAPLFQSVQFPTSPEAIRQELSDAAIGRMASHPENQAADEARIDLYANELQEAGYFANQPDAQHNGIVEAVPMSDEVLDARIEAIRHMTPEQISKMVQETSRYLRAIRSITLHNANTTN